MRSFIIAAVLASVGLGLMVDSADACCHRRRARRCGNNNYAAQSSNGCGQCSTGCSDTSGQPVGGGQMQGGQLPGAPAMNNALPPAPGPAPAPGPGANAPVPQNPQT